MSRATTTLRRWSAQARAAQLATLADLTALDAACIAHMQHGAMPTADPLTDSLYAQLEAPACEGALPATPYPGGLAATTGNGPGWWLASAALLATLAGIAFMPWRS